MHRTLAGAFLADSFGASVQHIAFATEDIFATLAHLQSRGFETLPISSNYYADLVARVDLPTEIIDKMQVYSVLYDEDAGGRFL